MSGIETKITVLGGPQIGAMLADVNSGLKSVLRVELAKIGQQIVGRASMLAPRSKVHRGGIPLHKRIIWFFGERRRVKGDDGARRLTPQDVAYEGGKIRFVAMPTGSVAHLMERGVNATRKGHHRRVTRRNVQIWTAKGLKTKKELKGKAWVKPHQLTIAPRRFFWPAVDSVGGESAIFGRLQGVIDSLVGNTNAEAA